MRKLFAVFVLLGSAFAQTIACGSAQSAFTTAWSSASCGSTITVQAQSGGSQCSYAFSVPMNLTNKSCGPHATAHANLGNPVTEDTVTTYSVTSITVDSGGGSYTSTPKCWIAGGASSTLATCTAHLTGGNVTSVTVDNGGSGFLAAPTVINNAGTGNIVSPMVWFTGGGVDIEIVSDELAQLPSEGRRIGTPAVQAIQIVNGGSGYTTATINISGGGGSGASATAVLSGGAVASASMGSQGSGYTSQPYCSITGDGTGATCYVILGRTMLASQRLHMPKIVTSSGTAAFTFASGAGNVALRGLEITNNVAAGTKSAYLIAINAGSNHHVTLDRNFIHQKEWPLLGPFTDRNSAAGSVSYSVHAIADDVVIEGNMVSNFGYDPTAIGQEFGSYAVVSDSPTDGMLLYNNFLEAQYASMFTGGSDPPLLNPGTITSASSPSVGTDTATCSAGNLTPCAKLPYTCSGSCSIGTLNVGDSVAVQVAFNGPRVNATAVRSSNVVTFTCTSTCPVVNGGEVSVYGMADNSFNTGPNTGLCGGYPMCGPITVVDSTHFTVASSGSNGSTSGGNIGPGYCKGDNGLNPTTTSCYTTGFVVSIDTVGHFIYTTPLVSYRWHDNGGYREHFDVMYNNVPSGTAQIITDGTGQVGWLSGNNTNQFWYQNQMNFPYNFGLFRFNTDGQFPKGTERKSWVSSSEVGSAYTGWWAGMSISSQNQGGQGPGQGASNIRLQSNWQTYTGAYGAFGNFFCESAYACLKPKTIIVANNLFSGWDNPGIDYNVPINVNQAIGSGTDVMIKHNTFTTGLVTNRFPCSTLRSVGTPTANGDCYTTKVWSWTSFSATGSQRYPNPKLTFRDNILGWGNYGGNCDTLTLSDCFVTLNSINNMIVMNANDGTAAFPNSRPNTDGIATNVSNFYIDSWKASSPANHQSFATASNAGMNDPANDDYTLKNTSVGHNAASDGTDVGVNFSALRTALGVDNPLPLGTSQTVPTIGGGWAIPGGSVIH